jgi:phosphoadenosine phosphosulfate reductase
VSLNKKVTQAKKVILETRDKYGDNVAVAWTGGKDSTLILFLIREVFGHIPWRVFFNDSTMEFDEIYQHVEKMKNEWKLDLVVERHALADLKKIKESDDGFEKQRIARMAKINSLNRAVKENKWEALITGIRIDEHESRADETSFSERNNHIRVHPILEFTEKDVWDYTKENEVPYVKLYNQGYRSLGEKPFTHQAKKDGNERSGREVDKEMHMKQLRSLGYY